MISQKIVQQELKRKGGVRFALDYKDTAYGLDAMKQAYYRLIDFENGYNWNEFKRYIALGKQKLGNSFPDREMQDVLNAFKVLETKVSAAKKALEKGAERIGKQAVNEGLDIPSYRYEWD